MQKDIHKQALKSAGLRWTTVREILLNQLETAHKPQSADELLARLKRKNLKPSKTTIYRQLETLTANGVLSSVNFHDGVIRYELNKHHHHHAVCKKCKMVIAVEDKKLEQLLKKIEQTMCQKNKFINLTHTLEFFGVCAKCS